MNLDPSEWDTQEWIIAALVGYIGWTWWQGQQLPPPAIQAAAARRAAGVDAVDAVEGPMDGVDAFTQLGADVGDVGAAARGPYGGGKKRSRMMMTTRG